MTACHPALHPCRSGAVARRWTLLAYLTDYTAALWDSEVYEAARQSHYDEVEATPRYEAVVGPVHRITDGQIERAVRRLLAALPAEACEPAGALARPSAFAPGRQRLTNACWATP